MSKEYDLYLEEHKANVAKAFYWIRDNLPEVLKLYYGNESDLEHQICIAHDWSKGDREEYEPYDRYFYGGNRSYSVVYEFNYAWLRHIHHNPHHWQYWILFKDDPNDEKRYICMDMPANYIIEMICDWMSFSFKTGNLREVVNWYQKHYHTIVISDKTRNTVDDIMKRIVGKINELENTAED